MGWREKSFILDPVFIEEQWGRRRRRIEWDDIVEIVGMNADNISYDSLWLLIRDRKNTQISIEQLNGQFHNLNKFLESKYETFPRDWIGRLEANGAGYEEVLWSHPHIERYPRPPIKTQNPNIFRVGFAAVAFIAYAYFWVSAVIITNSSDKPVSNVKVALADSIIWQGNIAPHGFRVTFGRPEARGSVDITYEIDGRHESISYGHVTVGPNATTETCQIATDGNIQCRTSRGSF